MSKNNVLYVKGMKIDEQAYVSENDDPWDDTKLNLAYERALKVAKTEIAKEVAMSSNSELLEEEFINSKSGNFAAGRVKTKTDNTSFWQPGMPCRAIYEDDGMEYEARIVRVINKEECVVTFIGYENTEIVPIETLKPTLGKREQKLQIQNAEGFNGYTDAAKLSDSDDNESMNKVKSPKIKQMPKKRKVYDREHHFVLPEIPEPNFFNSDDMDLPDMPLPPPPPPMSFTMTNRTNSEHQLLSSMLLSWYMTGYYTGLYKSMKRQKNNRQQRNQRE